MFRIMTRFQVKLSLFYSNYAIDSQYKESKSCFCNFEIPNTLQFRVIPPIKQADYKLIFGINQEIDKVYYKKIVKIIIFF